jgi:thiol-disulfide isomerase/thioredoxin
MTLRFLYLFLFLIFFPFNIAISETQINYEKGTLSKLILEDKTVFINYRTDWCTTCASQGRTIASLRNENSAYDENLIFVNVNFDLFKNEPVVKLRNIPRRSTLILIKGEREYGRLVAETSKRKIKNLLDIGLNLN